MFAWLFYNHTVFQKFERTFFDQGAIDSRKIAIVATLSTTECRQQLYVTLLFRPTEVPLNIKKMVSEENSLELPIKFV